MNRTVGVFGELLSDMYDKLFNSVNYIWVLVLSCFTMLVAPKDGCVGIETVGIVLMMFIDVILRIYAISFKAGKGNPFKGFFIAIWEHQILSSLYYSKMMKNILFNSIIIIIAGWSNIFIANDLFGISVYSVCYAFMFLGQIISWLENLRDGGVDQATRLLKFFKKKEKELLEELKE